MPGRDGSGPMGQGSRSGRGLGICTGINADRYGAGFGRGVGRFFGIGFFCRKGSNFRRNMNIAPISKQKTKEILTEQKEILQKELDLINQQLETSKDS